MPAHVTIVRVRPTSRWILDAQPYVENPATDADIPLAQRRSLLDLSSQTCRWPVGDPDHHEVFFFCGAPPLNGKPYCARHCARACRAESQRAVPRNRNGATLAKAGDASAAHTSRAGEGNEPRQESTEKSTTTRADAR
jgi:GcrA cell cycle regulator